MGTETVAERYFDQKKVNVFRPNLNRSLGTRKNNYFKKEHGTETGSGGERKMWQKTKNHTQNYFKKKDGTETEAGWKRKMWQTKKNHTTNNFKKKDGTETESGWKKKMWQKKNNYTGKPVKKFRKDDPHPGRVPVPQARVQRYQRGEVMTPSRLGERDRVTYERQQTKFRNAARQSARSEFLMAEESGYLELDPDDDVTQITQRDIADSVDVFSAQKYFELDLPQFGPYRMNFSRNGRHLALAGGKGHVAALDWQTKKLMCEMNVMETVNEVRWLHQETMFAVAQKQWTYVYDNQGIELHCLKMLNQVQRMEFLPYHFLLVTASSLGYLNYLDVSIGELVATHYTKLGRLDVMTQNPSNAIIHLGHSGGTVTLWSPNVKEPLVKMLCHGGGVRSIAVDQSGNYMATSGVDRHLKIWDLRMFRNLSSYRLNAGAGQLTFSQRGLLAAGMGNIVQVFKDPRRREMTSPYLHHPLPASVYGLQFCPHEDVLGVSHSKGYSSLLVPGAGEANFDALEVNPYQSKRQRQNAEVKMLLDKIQPELITMETSKLGLVDTKSLREKMEDKKKMLFLKVPKIDFEPKRKMKGKGKTGHVEKRKRIVQLQTTRQHVREALQSKAKTKVSHTGKPRTVLDRFQKRKT